MPNGKGYMECGYCLHWLDDDDRWGVAACHYEGRCNCWDAIIPENSDHRFCLDFTPNPYFGEDNGVGRTGEERTAKEIVGDALRGLLQYKPDLQIGVLYAYHPQMPEELYEVMRFDLSPSEETR